MGPTSVHERTSPRHSSWSASPPPPLIILRTTTTTVPWRTHDNDGVDGALIQSNEVDHVVRRIVQDRLEHQQPLGLSHRYQQSQRHASSSLPRAVSKASWAILDTYAMTRDLPLAHCRVVATTNMSPLPLKFFADDMHFQPFVTREFNRVLLSMLSAYLGRFRTQAIVATVDANMDESTVTSDSLLASTAATEPASQVIEEKRVVADHLLRQLRVACTLPSAVCEIEVQSDSNAAQQRSRSQSFSCSDILQDDMDTEEAVSLSSQVAYVLLSSPFRQNIGNKDGPVPSRDVLRLHLRALSVLPNRLQRLLIMLPSESALKGATWDEDQRINYDYLDIMDEAMRLPVAASVTRLPNNTLGSYGMYLAAYSMHRAKYDFYIFSEDDYIPTVAHYDTILLKLHAAAFGPSKTREVPGVGTRAGLSEAIPGVLCGLVQGRPVEPNSPLEVHLESSHIMSSRTLAHVMAYANHVQITASGANNSSSSAKAVGANAIDVARQIALARHLVKLRSQAKNGQAGPVQCRTHKTRCTANNSQSVAATSVMVNRFDDIQLGFGALLQAAGVEIRDWTAVFRSPYWDHHSLVDWSGAVSNFTVPVESPLFAPVQWLFEDRVRVCCGPSQQSCPWSRANNSEVRAACTVERRDFESRAGAGAARADDRRCCHEHIRLYARSANSRLTQNAVASTSLHAAASVRFPRAAVAAWTQPSCVLARKRHPGERRANEGIRIV